MLTHLPSSKMASLVYLVVTLFFAASALAVDDIESSLVSIEGRQASSVTVYTTTTIQRTTTTHTTVNKICGVLGFAVVTFSLGTAESTVTSGAPSEVCRQRRGFVDDVYVIRAPENEADIQQFVKLSPSQVIRFQPTLLPYFADPYPVGQAGSLSDVIITSSDFLEPSLTRQGPIFGGLFSLGNFLNSFVSSIVSNVVSSSARPAVTSTVTVTALRTSIITTFSSTKTYFVVGQCYPSGIALCSSNVQ